MSRLKHLEVLIGTGPVQLRDGEPVGEAAYELSIYQEVHDAGAEEVGGLRRIEGHVDGLDNSGLMGKELTLQSKTDASSISASPTSKARSARRAVSTRPPNGDTRTQAQLPSHGRHPQADIRGASLPRHGGTSRICRSRICGE